MRVRVAIWTCALTVLVLPIAAVMDTALFLLWGVATVDKVMGAVFAMIVGAILGPIFLGPLVWFSFRHQELSARLRDAALTDPLTGAPNRRAFFDHVAGRLAGTQAPRAFSLLMIDADRFKALNDRLGHDVGDAALIHVVREIGRELDRSGAPAAMLARLGGEEFAVFLDGADLATATGVAEAICAHLRSTAFVHAGEPIVVTVSVGVWSGTAAGSVDEALARADRAAYAAKANGRDRWEVAGDEALGLVA